MTARTETLDVGNDGEEGVRRKLVTIAAPRPSAAKGSSTFAPRPQDSGLAPATGPSLMEQMMQEAASAKAAKKRDEDDSRNPKKAFSGGGGGGGGGFKKGFLTTAASTKKTTQSSKTKTATNKSGDNSSSDSDIVNLGAPSSKKSSSLVFDQVQEALAAERKKVSNEEWLTQNLQDKITSDPKLASALQNPQFMQLLAMMQSDPGRGKEYLMRDPQARELFMQFSSVLGEHFTELGNVQGNKKEEESIGPLAKAAIERNSSGGTQEASSEEDEKVRSVLADPELRQLLSDADLQRVMMECSDPAKLRFYMMDAKYGPMLQKLKNAGLVSIL